MGESVGKRLLLSERCENAGTDCIRLVALTSVIALFDGLCCNFLSALWMPPVSVLFINYLVILTRIIKQHC